MDLMTGLAAQNGMATILITHDLTLAAQYCDRIVVMHAGHVVEDAPAAVLFSRPRHPYTARLVAATPAGATRLDDLASVPGGLPDLRGALPPCRYRARCERGDEACDVPLSLTLAGPAHHVACRRPL
jgi:peptide/nickel transport system ATP-binding protein